MISSLVILGLVIVCLFQLKINYDLVQTIEANEQTIQNLQRIVQFYRSGATGEEQND